jgi:hypothetical protein
MAFAQAMSQPIKYTTWNGAKTNTYLPSKLKLFYQSVRGLSKDRLFDLLTNSMKESVIDTVILCFHIRDCRGGKGERQLGRWCFEYLATQTDLFMTILPFISYYGRWDDLLDFSVSYQTINDQIMSDLISMDLGNPISLCSKWVPTENHSWAKKNPEKFDMLLKTMSLTRKEYRKTIGSLRQYLHIVESYMCNSDWRSIDYSKVPSCAMFKLKNAFRTNDTSRFESYLENVQSGKQEIKATQLFPHTLVNHYLTNRPLDTVVEEQWKVLVKSVKEMGTLQNAVCVCDVSGSMNGTPLQVAIGLSLLVSNVSSFGNLIITFSQFPSFVRVDRNATLQQQVDSLLNAHWDMNTDIQRVFDLILFQAKEHEVSIEDMPKTIFIISDMQFDQAENNTHTNMEVVEQKYKESGYTIPRIVFWNVNGATTDCPISFHTEGHTLVSGFSPSLLQNIMNCKSEQLSPTTIMNEVIQNERYDRIREKLA